MSVGQLGIGVDQFTREHEVAGDHVREILGQPAQLGAHRAVQLAGVHLRRQSGLVLTARETGRSRRAFRLADGLTGPERPALASRAAAVAFASRLPRRALPAGSAAAPPPPNL